MCTGRTQTFDRISLTRREESGNAAEIHENRETCGKSRTRGSILGIEKVVRCERNDPDFKGRSWQRNERVTRRVSFVPLAVNF